MTAEIMDATTELTRQDKIDHLQARVGYRRMQHKVEPGLYRVGSPDRSSPVLVSANYTLSYDALRTSLKGLNAYILVIDTNGINVWCAAGKGTFGTKEIVHRVQATGLADVVEHRRLILPQLGAPGVAAHEVKKQTGFTVEYGPVRAGDLPEYLRTGKATSQMREVTFPVRDRFILVPVEVVQSLKYLVPAAILLFLVGGWSAALVALVAVLGGAVLFPLLLPYLPTREFSSKGIVLGMALSLPLTYMHALERAGDPLWALLAYGVAAALEVAAVVGYLGLNFTGSSTYTSRTGVRKEIFRWIPVMVAMIIIGAVIMVIVIGNQLGWY